MKKIIIRIAILFGVFLASLVTFMFLLNHRQVESAANMAQPKLPLLYMKQADVTTNRMYGYRQDVNEFTMRESLTLLPVDRNLSIEIQPYENEIKSITYQVTSLEDGSVIENGNIKVVSNTDGNMTADFHIENPIAMGQEYMLKFTVDINEQNDINYYTRIVQRTGQNLSWYLSYADAFYQNCLSGNMTDEMISQLETESSSVNSSLHFVTLKSDKEQIAWGELSPTLEKRAVPTILEINETTVSLKLAYIISAENEEGGKEYYTVSEFYRMRKAQDQVVLLDFERTVTQFFNGNLPVQTEDGLNLGITSKGVDFVTNDEADIAAFVQAGELWLYNRSLNKVTRIFSYAGDNHLDDRTNNLSYNISVSSVAENGDTSFIVYGYRTAGAREGTVGISVYKYYAGDNTTKEELFIPIRDAYQFADQGLSRLSFVNSKDSCFMYYDNRIYSIRLEDRDVSILQDELDWQTVSVSNSQMLVAWNDGENNQLSTEINELNLETGETVTIEAPQGDYIKALGYMGEDIIYGLAHSADCYTDITGNAVFPMYRICIKTPEGEIAEEYNIENTYVTDISVEDNLIILKRVSNADGRMKQIGDDQLIHYAPQQTKAADVSLTVTERQGTQVHLTFAAWGENSNLLSLNTRYPSESDENILNIEEMNYGRDYYFVYAKGELYALYTQINRAIQAADNSVGVVLNGRQQYLWERGNTATTAMIDTAKIPQGLLSAPIEEEAVAQALPEGYNVWNLSGCSLDSIQYQISNGYCVIGQWSDTENKLIVGYDQFNIWLYDSTTGEAYAVAFEDAEAAFGSCGNMFISYHES
jgi:flagellar basal body-associated protein FliL